MKTIELDDTTYNMLKPIMKMQLQEEPAYAVRWLIHWHALITKIIEQHAEKKKLIQLKRGK